MLRYMLRYTHGLPITTGLGLIRRMMWCVCWDTPQRLPTTTGVAFFEDDGYMLRYTPGLPTTPSIGLVYDVMCMLRYTPGLLATTGLGLLWLGWWCVHICYTETHNGKHQSRRLWLPASCVSSLVIATRLVGDLDWFVNFVLKQSNYWFVNFKLHFKTIKLKSNI